MGDIEWFNQQLTYWLNEEESYAYRDLIQAAIESSDVKTKSELIVLLMDHRTEKLTTKLLREAITKFYCSDVSLDEYLKKIVSYNPKFGTISISASHGLNMEHDYNLDITVPVAHKADLDEQFEEVNRVEKKIKEVLKMILVETKSIV